VQRALEAAAAKRLEEERIAAAIQAAKEAEEAEIKRIEEEERAAKEEKDRKKAAKKAAKDEATKAGKAVSAKDKEREAANARYLSSSLYFSPFALKFVQIRRTSEEDWCRA
jgi:hypothetical protein